MKIRANGIDMKYTLNGAAAAPVVMFSHSLATQLEMWEPQAQALAGRYRILRYDTRGHGGTAAPVGPYSLDLLAQDAAALMEALGIDRAHFVGLSMGGMIGQCLALTRPERLRSLALCDTSSRVPPDARAMWDERVRVAETQGMEPHVEGTLSRWFTPGFGERQPAVVERVRAMIRHTSPTGYAGCCHAIKVLDLTDRLSAIRARTLVIVGEDDPGTPVAASRTIQERIPGARLVIIPAASHLSNLEQPEAFTQALTAFLEQA